MKRRDVIKTIATVVGGNAPLGALISSGSVLAAEPIILGRASTWYPPNHPTNTGGYNPFIRYVEEQTHGSVKFKLWVGSALLDARASLPGVEKGVADVTSLALTYFPAEFPYANLFSELAFNVDDPYVASGALTELAMLECLPCQEEFLKKGIIYTGGYATSPYVMMSKTKLSTAEDLKGKRYRSSGNVYDRWVSYIGGTPTNVSSAEIFSAMNGGGLDVAIFSASGLESFSIWDVAKYVNLMPLGLYSAMSTFTINRAFWRKLVPAQRRVVLDGAALGNVYTTRDYISQSDQALKRAPQHHVEQYKPSEAVLALKHDFVRHDNTEILKIAKNKYKIADAQRVIDKYLELIAKWKEIVSKLDDDPDKLVDAYRHEIYAKVNPETYGI